MVSFDIGDNRYHRLQMQERRVALISFRNQITTVAEPRMNARRFNQTAINKCRIETGFRINAGDHRRGRGFAVRTGNRDAMTKTHQLSQHFCTTNNRDARFMRGDNFRVIGRDRAGDHNNARIEHVFRAMIEIDSRPKRRQLLRNRIRRQIGTADLVTFVC
ncbi:hypothetical protein D3C72_978920 [compost metagenome]